MEELGHFPIYFGIPPLKYIYTLYNTYFFLPAAVPEERRGGLCKRELNRIALAGYQGGGGIQLDNAQG